MTSAATPPGRRLSLSMSGRATTTITASVDGQQVVLASDSRSATGTPPWESGPAGIEAGAFTSTWPQAQYSTLSITPYAAYAGAARPLRPGGHRPPARQSPLAH